MSFGMFVGGGGIVQRSPAKHSATRIVQSLMRASLLILFIAASAFGQRFTAPETVRLKQHERVIVIRGIAHIDAPFSNLISEAARTYGVDPRLMVAIARRESAFNPNAVSRVGACGLMQLMPATARLLGVNDIFDVRQNVFGGAQYLRTLLDAFHGERQIEIAVEGVEQRPQVLRAAYNAGPGAVQKYNGVPPFRETRAYIARIVKNWQATAPARSADRQTKTPAHREAQQTE